MPHSKADVSAAKCDTAPPLHPCVESFATARCVASIREHQRWLSFISASNPFSGPEASRCGTDRLDTQSGASVQDVEAPSRCMKKSSATESSLPSEVSMSRNVCTSMITYGRGTKFPGSKSETNYRAFCKTALQCQRRRSMVTRPSFGIE